MRNTLFAAALAVLMVTPGLAAASESSDRAEAVRLCRAEVAAQAGLDEGQVRFDRAHVGARSVRIDLDVWRDGRLQNVRCDVARGETLTIASIDPALQVSPAAVAAAH